GRSATARVRHSTASWKSPAWRAACPRSNRAWASDVGFVMAASALAGCAASVAAHARGSGGAAMMTLPFEGYAVTHGGLAFSPDGRYLAATSRHRTVVFGGSADPVAMAGTTPDGPVAWLEGGRLAICRREGVAVHDPATGRKVF